MQLYSQSKSIEVLCGLQLIFICTLLPLCNCVAPILVAFRDEHWASIISLHYFTSFFISSDVIQSTSWQTIHTQKTCYRCAMIALLSSSNVKQSCTDLWSLCENLAFTMNILILFSNDYENRARFFKFFLGINAEIIWNIIWGHLS